MSDVRKLGFWECTCKVYHENFKYSSMVLQYARFKGPMTPDLARRGLQLIQKRHPLLQCRFESYDDCYDQLTSDHYKGSISDVPLEIVDKQSDTHWKTLSEDELYRDLEGDYLWRATLLLDKGPEQIHDLVLIFHHSISDGTSNAFVVKDFLSYCGELAAGAQEPKDYSSESILPPVEGMIPNALEGSGVQSDLVPQDRATDNPLTAWPFEDDCPLEERRSRNLYYTFDAETIANLRNRARAEGATVNSVLTAALLAAAFEESEPTHKNDDKEHHALFSSAISLRNACEPKVGREHFGCYVMVVGHAHPMGGTFWDLARNCDQGLKAEIAAKDEGGFLPPAYDKREVANGMVGALGETNKNKVFACGPVISNLGLLDFPREYGVFELEDLYFSTTQVAGNFNIILWALTLHGKLYACFTYTEPLFSAETATKIVENLVVKVKAAAQPAS